MNDARLDALAIDGVLPFEAIVEGYDDGRWYPQASGSSVAWLRSVAAELEFLGPTRIVSRLSGEVLAGTSVPEGGSS